jgi:hypothetical protein
MKWAVSELSCFADTAVDNLFAWHRSKLTVLQGNQHLVEVETVHSEDGPF